MVERIEYDEFGLFGRTPPSTAYRRPPADGSTSDDTARRWPHAQRPRVGEAPPELVLLHGGAQNAHTWDTVALALRRPLVAIDLPGHGHSDSGAGCRTRPAPTPPTSPR